MNNPEYYTKEIIDDAIRRLIDNRVKTQLTSLELIKMMSGEEELTGHLSFYTSILEGLMNGDKNISYNEKEQFLILHKCLIETYNELNANP